MLRVFCFVLTLIVCNSASADPVMLRPPEKITGVQGPLAAHASDPTVKEITASGGQRSVGGVQFPVGSASAVMSVNNTACGRYPYPPCAKSYRLIKSGDPQN